MAQLSTLGGERMKNSSYSFAKDCCGAILVAVGVLGLLYLLLWVRPLGVFGTYFWTGMAMPQRTQAEYEAVFHHQLWSVFFLIFIPFVVFSVAMVLFGVRLRQKQQRLLD